MKRCIAALIVAVSLVSVASAQTDTTATIASWNLAGFNPIPGDRADRIAKGIVRLDAEVIAVQEVNPDSILTQIVAKANALGGKYQAPIILAQTANQNVAILAKEGVSVTNPRFIAGSNVNNPGLRKALVADVRIGKFDFTMIVVHLKASRPNADHDIRTKQGCSPAEARNTAVFHLYSRVFRGELAIDAVIDSFRPGKLGAESQNRSETTVEFVQIPRPSITEHMLQLRQNSREILFSGTGASAQKRSI